MIVHGFAGNDLFPARFGASQRLLGLYRGLAARHTTHVLAVVPNRHPGPDALTVHGILLRRHRAWYTSVAWRLERWRIAPMITAMYGHRFARRDLLSALPGAPDVVIADIGVAGVLQGVRGALRVYHAHNVEFDHFVSAGPVVWLRDRWAQRFRSLEARACANADVVTVTGEPDAARMRELYAVPDSRIVVIPNGYDETAIRAPAASERAAARRALGFGDAEHVALFLGSDVPHNRAALEVLVQQVMPSLAGRGVRLLVVGSVANALAGRPEPWLTVLPETDDVVPALHAADTGLNPVTGGSGSNVKLPTYLAAGLAVVTTRHGLRGYDDLAPLAVVAEPAAMPEALGARPRGWHARGEPVPPVLADYAWGRLGARWGDRLEAYETAREATAARIADSASAHPRGARA